jgi:hypothetical protein
MSYRPSHRRASPIGHLIGVHLIGVIGVISVHLLGVIGVVSVHLTVIIGVLK